MSKAQARAPASSLLMTFLTIKPSWSGLVITSAATSRTFLISTVLPSSSIAGAPAKKSAPARNLFRSDRLGRRVGSSRDRLLSP